MLSILIVLHITSGAIGLLTGFLTILLPKGDQQHKRTGNIYIWAMLSLGVTGAIVAFVRDIPLSMMNGLVICYFVLTSLSTIRNPIHSTTVFDKALMASAWFITAGFVYFVVQVTGTETGQLGGFGPGAYVVFGSVMFFSAIADTRYLVKSGLSRKQQLVRHLWRMLFPLFMASAAFFLGQATLFPQSLQAIEILIIPVVFVILSLLYWTVKVNLRFYERKPIISS